MILNITMTNKSTIRKNSNGRTVKSRNRKAVRERTNNLARFYYDYQLWKLNHWCSQYQ